MSWVYIKTDDNSARFALGEINQKSGATLACIGINPSTATPEALDNTLRRVKDFSEINGFENWIMLNVYPQRATNPDDLDLVANKSLNKKNLQVIRTVLDTYDCTLWAAWGNLIGKRDYLWKCLWDIAILPDAEKWVRFGSVTKELNPRHPLYLKRTTSMEEFNICEYISQMLVKNERIKIRG